MTLRTPRRRISPRTKRRCRAIKDFLRRAIGSTSQPDIKINSSIAVNVTNLKHQIVGIEQQLNAVSKHLVGTECCTSTNNYSAVSDSTAYIRREENESETTKTIEPQPSTERNHRRSEMRLLYKTLNDRKSDESDLQEKSETDRDELKHVAFKKSYTPSPKNNTRKKKSKRKLNAESKMDEIQPSIEKHKSKSAYEHFLSSYSTNSYHSLIEQRPERTLRTYDDRHNTRQLSKHGRQRTHERCEIERDIRHIEPKEIISKRAVRNEDKHVRRRKDKGSRESHEIDPDFISNIIKRQYGPVKMFDRRESDHSQFSAPVCRDQEFVNHENILEGSDLCSCGYANGKPGFAPYNVDDIRSICDTRLYSSKNNTRQKTYRRKNNNYNDSSMYDMVPVKEKSSPKSQRKFIEDMMYTQYKEVPPCPRTLRPRLNLKSQHYSNMDFDETTHNYRSKKYSPNRINRRYDYIDSYSNESSTVINQKIPCIMKSNKQDNIQQTLNTSSTLPSPFFDNGATNVNQTPTANKTMNKSQDIECNSDRTDKALCEIKNILQSFLQEIKKESISHVKDIGGKKEGNENNLKMNTNAEEPSCHSDINNCNMSPFSLPPPYIPPPYMNPCCYPMLPTYPINSFIVPSPSFTCATCINKVEQPNNTNKENLTNHVPKADTETDKLIKEIYNLVTQSPPATRRGDNKSIMSHRKEVEKRKAVVTRSVGDSIRITRHDANVGTPKLKYYSKSCEAIGSALDEEHTTRTTASYSDTVLEKVSLDVTGGDSTTTETEISTEINSTEKKQQNGQNGRFSKVLRSFGLLKKKKKDVIEEESEEESESESSTEVEIKKKNKKPEFPQNLNTYMMHGQEYFHPPISPHFPQEYFPHQPNLHSHHYRPYPGYPGPLIQPTAPPCCCAHEGHHNQHQKQPEGPLCLKEIEVKSTATQSDRKISFFGKFGKRKPIEVQTMLKSNSMPQNCSTQTAQNKPGFWQRLNAPKPMTASDPRVFSFKKRAELAAGDAKMKNKMIKKIFHKRNPFSPRNLIVRTLMGKDPSSFGEPPVMYRPRMFL